MPVDLESITPRHNVNKEGDPELVLAECPLYPTFTRKCYYLVSCGYILG